MSLREQGLSGEGSRHKERGSGFLMMHRKIERSILIWRGEDKQVEIKVLGIERARAKLGIYAPHNMSVLREELAQMGEIRDQSKSADSNLGSLVLTRKIDQGFIINHSRPDQIEVVVFGIERDIVKIGLRADPSIPIARNELAPEPPLGA